MFIKVSLTDARYKKQPINYEKIFDNYVLYCTSNCTHFIFSVFIYIDESIEFINSQLTDAFKYDNINIQCSEFIYKLIDEEMITNYLFVGNNLIRDKTSLSLDEFIQCVEDHFTIME